MQEFYNETDNNDYPFLAGFDRNHSGGVLGDKGMLDFRLTVGPDTGFIESTDFVTYSGFNVGATDVIFTFTVQNVGLINFVVPLLSPFGFSTTAEIIILGKVVATGVLVTADLSDYGSLAIGPYIMLTPPQVEPTLITSLRGAFVTEFISANSPRRRPLDCCDEVNFGPLPPPTPVPEVFSVNTYPILGELLLLKEGFNCFISLTTSSNTLTIGARLGAGAGEDDGSDPFLIDNWVFQAPTPYKCNDFISSINGVTSVGNVLRILTSGGMTISDDAMNNTLNTGLSNAGEVCP